MTVHINVYSSIVFWGKYSRISLSIGVVTGTGRQIYRIIIGQFDVSGNGVVDDVLARAREGKKNPADRVARMAIASFPFFPILKYVFVLITKLLLTKCE